MNTAQHQGMVDIQTIKREVDDRRKAKRDAAYAKLSPSFPAGIGRMEELNSAQEYAMSDAELDVYDDERMRRDDLWELVDAMRDIGKKYSFAAVEMCLDQAKKL